MLATALLSGPIWADDAADRASIEKTVAALNEVPIRAAIFTADFDGRAELQRLLETPKDASGEAKPSVIISKQPWGEATIVLPGMAPHAPVVVKKIRLVSPDVGMADATGNVPALIVQRKEGTDWKIASLRILEK